ncbi:MAG: aldo/keto reductase [Chloroflexi bacterium]|nr:aldo/keto reductase [Chloroflexota bacterium]
MQSRPFGDLGEVSAYGMGGGGVGLSWGATPRDEAAATVREAIAAGITLIDVAPSYGQGEAERLIGEVFDGHLPSGVRLCTKVPLFAPWSPIRDALLANHSHKDIEDAIERSFRSSLDRLKVKRVDVLFVHDQILPDGWTADAPGLPRGLFVEAVRPVLERICAEGRAARWGLSALGLGPALLQVFEDEPPPFAAQVATNALRSRSALSGSEDPTQPEELIAAAVAHSIAVVGIQPTQGGALTDGFDRPLAADHPYMADFNRAARFRDLARTWGATPAALAHRYALSIGGVSTVLLGVKNRPELREALEAEAAGPLDPAAIAQIEASVAPS